MRSTPPKATRVGVALAGVPLLIPLVASSATAHAEPTLVNLLGCQLLDGGTTSVPEGSEVTLRLPGFASGNRGLIRVMLNAATATLSLWPSDGPAWSVEVTDTFGVTALSPRNVIARPANVPLGPLSAGQSIDVVYRLGFDHPLAILYPPVGPSGDNGPYLTRQEDDVACRISATP